MKKILKLVCILVFVAFAVIQIWRPERTNPPVKSVETLTASTQVPRNVNEILKRSCKDCHSNETVFPWYSNIAPISWSVVDHVREGRDELNFSIWNTYSVSRKKRKLEEICEQVEERQMPHNQYLWLHWDAALSNDEIKILCDWTGTEIGKISSQK